MMIAQYGTTLAFGEGKTSPVAVEDVARVLAAQKLGTVNLGNTSTYIDKSLTECLPVP